MVIVRFGVLWAGYLLMIQGWGLLKGWNITIFQLATPVNPYQWPVPPGVPAPIPATQVWPSAKPVKAPGPAPQAT